MDEFFSALVIIGTGLRMLHIALQGYLPPCVSAYRKDRRMVFWRVIFFCGETEASDASKLYI